MKPIISRLQSAIDKRSNEIRDHEKSFLYGWFDTEEGEALSAHNLKRLRETQTLEKRLYKYILRSQPAIAWGTL